MKQQTFFENYPFWIVLISNLLSISICLIGAIIVYKLGLICLILYLIYILILELRLIKGHCVDCYYYGKTCAFGKGRICSMFFKKGNSNRFCNRKMTWKDMILDLLVSLIPFVIGIMLLIKNFDWTLLIEVIILFLLTSLGNSLIRSKLACKYCKQRKLGCPAQKLFEKRK